MAGTSKMWVMYTLTPSLHLSLFLSLFLDYNRRSFSRHIRSLYATRKRREQERERNKQTLSTLSASIRSLPEVSVSGGSKGRKAASARETTEARNVYEIQYASDRMLPRHRMNPPCWGENISSLALSLSLSLSLFKTLL